ncbi:Arc family DNA-binding protein [Agrobacterium tumefaciens]|uniref:Arc family DNA-binding protein n=1 Tax=Agrobacterium tumefaciens TaxID=358 RepID=UPI001574909D|nr:Arc family DNA-binding protein [Agrobacterium tumefaciens]NSY99705.1 Arc family DNA-binding protein [Agrobacterium tumefaciens]NSZ40651.1 Arc family DNA-binding protein [Agrobacterium tumefaciens]NTB22465.1 Arc family DNA-binding protein [Agrobacterium tumefaciens]NTB27394.1 Arc family DNA-binding protein [Agrobacterium tumefaciens]NTB36055.1 Arc family DNA-binding protein [Agrobacterium tumefaciens]
MKQSTGRASDQFNLRFPEGMRDRISLEADKAGRSMNAEIIARLSFTLDGNLGDKEKLNAEIDRYQKMVREYINQIIGLVTAKNALALLNEHGEVARKQNLIFLEALCQMIISEQQAPENLKDFASKTLASIECHNETDDLKQVLPSDVPSTQDEVQAIIRDVTENAEERAKSDVWAQAFGNNGFYTTVDISQRDPTKIPDAPEEKGVKSKKGDAP